MDFPCSVVNGCSAFICFRTLENRMYSNKKRVLKKLIHALCLTYFVLSRTLFYYHLICHWHVRSWWLAPESVSSFSGQVKQIAWINVKIRHRLFTGCLTQTCIRKSDSSITENRCRPIIWMMVNAWRVCESANGNCYGHLAILITKTESRYGYMSVVLVIWWPFCDL